MNIQKSKLKRLSLAVAIGLMSNTVVVPLVSNAYAAETTTEQPQGNETQEPAQSNPEPAQSNPEQTSNGGGDDNNSGGDGDDNNSGTTNRTPSAAEQAAQVLGASGQLPVPGSTAKYSWKSSVPGVQAYPICTGTKAPTQNEEVSYNCIVVGNNAYGAAIPIKGVAKGGKESLGGVAPFFYIDKSDPENPVRKMGIMSIQININGYQGKTTMGGSDGWGGFNTNSNWGVDPYSKENNWIDDNTKDNTNWFDPTNNNDDNPWTDATNAKGSNLCPDGTYFCSPSSDNTSLFGENGGSSGYWGPDGLWHNPDGTTSTSPGGTSSGGYYDENGVWHNPDGTTGGGGYYDKNGIWHNSDETSSTGSNPYDSSSDSNYGNILDKLLNDNGNSYNSGDSDWASSNGGSEGSSNLDDYFNGTGDGADGLDGLTEDLLGVDDELLKEAANGDAFNSDGFDESGANDEDGENAWAEDGSGLTDNASLWDGDSDSLQNLMNAMDGISGDGSMGGSDGVNGADGDSSLMGSLSKFLQSIGGPETGVVGSDVTDQEMFEIAKKLLMANGISLDDILAGKTYDKGSAYTEPRQAWDMNRITTLLGKGKIKVKSDSGDVKKSHSSITSASNRNKAINANLKK